MDQEVKNKGKVNIYLPPPKMDRPYLMSEIYEEYQEPLLRIFTMLLKTQEH